MEDDELSLDPEADVDDLEEPDLDDEDLAGDVADEVDDDFDPEVDDTEVIGDLEAAEADDTGAEEAADVPDILLGDLDPETELVSTGAADDDELDGLREGEFVCRSCYMAKRESALANAKRMLCRDCA